MIGVGFKNKSWKYFSNPKFKIKEFKRELKYGWQRFWDGFDAKEVFCMNDMFRCRYLEILNRYKKNSISSWWCPEEYTLGEREPYSQMYILTDEQQEVILDMMIHHLNMMDEDYVIKEKYGIDVKEDNYLIEICKLKSKEHRIINSVMQQNAKLFFKLFDMFYWQLWD